MSQWHRIRYLVLLVLLGVAAYEFSPFAHELTRLYDLRNSLNYWWLLFAVGIQILQYGGEGYFKQRLLRIMNAYVGLRDTVRIASLEVFATHLLPMGQFGLFAANFYFYHRLGVDTSALLLLNLAIGAVTVVVIITMFLVSLLAVPETTFSSALHLYVLGVFSGLVLTFLALMLVALRTQWLRRWLRSAATKVQGSLFPGSTFANWRSYRKLIGDHKVLFFGLIAQKDIFYYLSDILTLISCFLAFHSLPALSVVMLAYTLALAAGAAAVVPGGLGATDATLGIVLLTTSVDPVTIVGVVLLYRFVSLVLPIPWGAFSYYSLTHDLGRAREQRTEAQPAGHQKMP